MLRLLDITSHRFSECACQRHPETERNYFSVTPGDVIRHLQEESPNRFVRVLQRKRKSLYFTDRFLLWLLCLGSSQTVCQGTPETPPNLHA